DMVPRVFSNREWTRLERGIKQRARALNAFLADVYDRGEIIRAGRIPSRLVYLNEAYEKAVAGFRPPKGVYSHVVGVDLVRTGPDQFYVLEDNCRTPSGVSYMLENREIMMRM
ncbi:MAG: circularly permuted type 2 ATP-grasp protein, partial [Rhodobacteraceae bacterium]|nr:circularly permuted type 2 ATP-grasp protein [Paracoccaceae bacterium]